MSNRGHAVLRLHGLDGRGRSSLFVGIVVWACGRASRKRFEKLCATSRCATTSDRGASHERLASNMTKSSGQHDHRPRMGRHQGAEHAAAELVALHPLRDHRVGVRLLDRLSGLADGSAATRAACSAIPRAPSSTEHAGRPRPRAQACDRSADRRLPVDRSRADPELLNYCAWPAAARPSRPIARPAMAPAARAARAIPCWPTTTGSGAAISPASNSTIRYGIRNTHAETRAVGDAALRRRPVADAAQIADVADYVLSLSGEPTDKPRRRSAASAIFAEQCAACHGEDGKGNQELGAPNLTDEIWLYGGSRGSRSSRRSPTPQQGVMPTWEGTPRRRHDQDAGRLRPLPGRRPVAG